MLTYLAKTRVGLSGEAVLPAINLHIKMTQAGSAHAQHHFRAHTKVLFFGHTRENHKDNHIQPGLTETKIPVDRAVSKSSGKNAKKAKTAAPVKLSLWGKILQTWADEDSVLRLSWTSVATGVVTLIGAGIFYGIESQSKCRWDYWQSLWFVNTIVTTIGYGTVAPCTYGGRALAVIFAFVSIPLNVVALSDIGKLLARLLQFLWLRLQQLFRRALDQCRKRRRNKVQIVVPDSAVVKTDADQSPPLTVAVVFAAMWFCLSSAFFALTEAGNMNFADSLYFMLISVTTIGFGDVAPKQYGLVLPQFFFIVIGIAVFSMVINIIQDKVDDLNDYIEQLINKEYYNAQQEGVQMEAMDEAAARNHVRSLIKKQKGGSVLHLVMGKNMENRLVGDYMEKAKKTVKSTQTDPGLDKEVMACPDISHASVEANSLATSKSKGTQLKWMPTIYADLDWLNVMYTSDDKRHQSLKYQKSLFKVKKK